MKTGQGPWRSPQPGLARPRGQQKQQERQGRDAEALILVSWPQGCEWTFLLSSVTQLVVLCPPTWDPNNRHRCKGRALSRSPGQLCVPCACYRGCLLPARVPMGTAGETGGLSKPCCGPRLPVTAEPEGQGRGTQETLQRASLCPPAPLSASGRNQAEASGRVGWLPATLPGCPCWFLGTCFLLRENPGSAGFSCLSPQLQLRLHSRSCFQGAAYTHWPSERTRQHFANSKKRCGPGLWEQPQPGPVTCDRPKAALTCLPLK